MARISITAPSSAAEGERVSASVKVTSTLGYHASYKGDIEALPQLYPGYVIGEIDQIIKSGDSVTVNVSFTMPDCDTTIFLWLRRWSFDHWVYDGSASKVISVEIVVPETFHLSVSVHPDGYVDPGAGSYPAYTTVTLTARPLSGYQFVRWGGDASGTSPTFNLYMDSHKHVEAYFEKIPVPTTFHLSILVPSWAAGGYVDPGSGDYPANTTVTLTAHPLSGYQFTGWGGDAGGTSLTYNLYMSSDKNVEAYFEKVVVPVEFEGTISRKELEYSGSGDGIVPVANVPQGVRAKLHVWGRNDMATSEKLGIYWFVADPDGHVVEEYEDWQSWPFSTTPPGETHEFISSGQFDLNKVGKYTTWIELLMNPDDPEVVYRYIGDLCTIEAAVPEPEFRGFEILSYV